MGYASVAFDLGSYAEAQHGDANVTGTAGGAGDGVEATGAFVQVPLGASSAVMLINWTATLAADETFSLAANAQDATDAAGTGAADFKATAAAGADDAGKQTLAETVVATGGAGGTTATGVTKIRFPDPRAHRGFLASQVTGSLSAGGVDTFHYDVVWLFGGAQELPGATTNVTSNA